jgi:hypothetical protein
MTFENLQQIFSYIQEDIGIFDIKYDGWPLWSLLKDRLFNAFLSRFIAHEKESILQKIRHRFAALLIQIIKIPFVYLKWKLHQFKFSTNTQTPVVMLIIDGFFRYKDNNGFYVYPYGEFLSRSNIRNFDIFSIERNNRVRKKGKYIIKVNISEDFTSFTFPFLKLFNKESNYISSLKNKLFDRIEPRLKNYPELIPIFKKELNSKLINKILYSFPIEKKRAKKLLRTIKPVVLLLTAPVGHLGWVAAAKELKIKVIEFQHGIVDKYQPQYNWPAELKDNKSMLLVPDQIFMWGKYWVEENVKLGFWTNDELFAYGNFKIDALRKTYSNLIKANLEKKSGKIILVYTSCKPIRKEAIKFLDEFLHKVSDLNLQIEVIIKLHPFEDSEYPYYNKLVLKHRNFCKVYYHREKSLFDLFSLSKVHLSVFSAAILESVELGLPTVILNLPGKEYFRELIERNIVKYIPDVETLLKLCDDISNSNEIWNTLVCDTRRKAGILYSTNSNESIVKHLNDIIKNAK